MLSNDLDTGMASVPENEIVCNTGDFRTAGCRHKLLAAGEVRALSVITDSDLPDF